MVIRLCVQITDIFQSPRFFLGCLKKSSYLHIIDLDQCRNVFVDHYAFRLTGSTAASLIQILHQVSELLLTHPCVHIISLDISKAFDTVRHSTFMEILEEFPLPDKINNWVMNYLAGRSNCTKFAAHCPPCSKSMPAFFRDLDPDQLPLSSTIPNCVLRQAGIHYSPGTRGGKLRRISSVILRRKSAVIFSLV